MKSYLQKIGEAGLDLKELLSLENLVLEGLFHSGNPAYCDSRFEDLKERLDYFESELKRVGVNRKLYGSTPYSYLLIAGQKDNDTS
ncbi:hypothetical protein FKG96_22300 [Olivibacter sp. LS-1]|uniref:hypothetical protein n=1 Tax=Olivibacter sp. LS-1 TaxID=2592345 RepID=UPI0011EA9762|nr:hypothetical protein [Olivibacter sp. LS-1]QEL03444.1 hypothetical protein FKG96_22300 [Olivibacter sp. LS-1]